VIAVLLALAAACAFAVSTVVQHRTATDAAATGDARWLVRLVRRPAWLVGQAASALGAVLHVAALGNGPVVLVQPLLASGLVLSLALGAWLDRGRPGRPGRGPWLGALAVAVGLTTFLLAARPAPGSATAGFRGLLLVTVAVLLLSGLAALWSRRPGRPHRALVRGAAAGAGFAVTGLLLKQLTGERLLSWATVGTALALAAVAVTATALSQAAFAAGPLVESLPVLSVLEPGVAVLLAGPLFGEWLLAGAAARAWQLTGALLLGLGLVVVARASSRRAPQRASWAQAPMAVAA
jgi:hypothetical protein